MRVNLVLLASYFFALVASQQTYQLLWSDEFNGNSLDLTKWQYEVNCDGGGNNELQCYTNSPNNVAVQNGSLVITAIPQNLNGKQYTSGRINTAASAAWKYGRIDFSAKSPNGIYLWPALWMMPRDNVYGGWAASGEIDIFESRSTQNTQESTLHYGGSWPNNVYQGSGPQVMNFDMAADFHLYSAIWTPTEIQFLVDNRVYSTQTLQRSFWSGTGTNPYTASGQPFDQYFYLIINLAIGGGFFGQNANSLTPQQAQAWASAKFYIDYVRVYQLTNSAVVTPTPSPVNSQCSSMYAGLTCRTTSEDPTQLSTNDLINSQNWLCGSYPQYCTAIQNNGQYASCNAAQKLSYAMNTYYAQFSYQGASACSFGGIGVVNQATTTKAVASTTKAAASTTKVATSTTKAAVLTSTTKAAATPTSSSDVAPCARAGYCASNACACNGACYSPTQYCCKNGGLIQIAFC